jgi:tetratricopeptide (TPR) repeat protein
MKRLISGGILALVTGLSGLMAQKQPQPKSQKEVEALQAMFGAQDPDTRIKAAEDLLTKFADTDFKGIALFFETASYEQKNDYDKVVIFGERTLEADPKNYQAMLMLARNIAAHTREHDLDREEKLAKAEKYARDAQAVLKDAPKPNPQITDDQWAAAKKDFESQAHEALALAAMARKKFDVAIPEFKAAVDAASQPDPATMVRLANAYNQAGKPDEALPLLEKVMAMPNLHPSIRQFAQAERVRAMQAKGGAAKPPAPAAAPPAGSPATPPAAPAPPAPKQ